MTRAGKIAIGLSVGLVAVVVAPGLVSQSCTIVDRFPPGPPSAHAEWETRVSLTATTPVAARVVGIRVAPSTRRADPPDLDLGAEDVTSGVREKRHARDVWVSIFDPDTGHGTPNPGGTGHATLDNWIGSGMTFENCDSVVCTARYVIVARWLTPVAGQHIDVKFFARISAGLKGYVDWGASPTLTPDPGPDGMSIEEDPELAFDGAPTVVTTQASGSGRISLATATFEQRLELDIPASALTADVGYPLVGRALVLFDSGDASDRNIPPWIHLSGPAGTIKAVADIAVDTDVLAACRPDVACSVPLTVALTFPEASPNWLTPAPDATAEASWTVVVRIERLGPGATPAGELGLHEVTR